MRKTKFAIVLAFAPVLLGADNHYGTISDELMVSSLPKCGQTEYLQYAGGSLVCAQIGGGAVSLPDCTGKLLTYLQNGEIASYNCTDKGAVSLSTTDITTINNLDTIITQIGTTLNNIKMNPRASAAVYVGSTTATTKGRINDMQGNIGPYGATKACEGQFGAGARMCTVYDMFVSQATGKITSNTAVPKSWVYQASWNEPVAGPSNPGEGVSENCASYIYETADQRWQGTAVTWATTALNGTDKALQFASNTPCNNSLPIACCK